MSMLGKDLEITPTQALFVIALYNSGSLSGSEIVHKIINDLGEEWSPTAGATYKLIQNLENKGLIEETTSEENRSDQRVRTYTLTSKGKGVVPQISNRFSKFLGFMLECCPDCCENIGIKDKSDLC